MKNFLSIVGGIFLVLLLVAAIVFGYTAYRGKGLDASSKAYIEEHIPTILQTWSKDELLKLSAPQLIENINNNQNNIDLFFKKLTELGKFQKIYDIKGDSNVSITTKDGIVITARYVFPAKFDKGKANITVQMIQSAGQWQLLGFFVNSPKFLQ